MNDGNVRLSKSEYDTAQALLADLSDTTPGRHIPQPGPVAPGIAPFVVPDGYTVRETHKTNTDGSTEMVREVVPLEQPTPPPAAPRRAMSASPDPASLPTAFMERERRTLPQWLTWNRRKLKAATYLAGVAAVTTVGAVYGNDIVDAIDSGLHTLWGATITVLKVVGVVLAGALFLRIVFGGARRKRSGGFSGTWWED
ncbi:hypothetical protein HUT19_42005 (plasmid) [Streptomyces sp. NA02950]|uniref:hypothetical protein n=1 Tax=Streptomyces sp. NA02950 TaxID=2742137 RepID=UPI0015904999|nr:hypothetical protein [Streptomyces sp. NA02950]QKV98293.1 hypothetical protein HUT19_42005 [Streptomyces sp. NA02950]